MTRLTRLRSLLFVPGDRPDRMPKALASGADALILDLEDAVAPSRKAFARDAIRAFLQETDRTIAQFVRINPLDSGLAAADLDTVLAAKPTGIVLPKAEGAGSIAELCGLMDERDDTDTLIIPIATETPRAIFALGDYVHAGPRLAALTWGAEDLPAAVGALESRLDGGGYTPPYEIARALTLFAAVAASVPPIETVYPAIKDLDGLADYAAKGARDGFVGMMALHPAQVPILNRAFTPSDVAIAKAQAVVDAFAADPEAGVLMLDGRMIDGPHLRRARTLLARSVSRG